MSYRILIDPAAERQLAKLPPMVQKSIGSLIDSLATEPRPSGCKKLKGRKGEYRVRSGNYRVICTIKDSVLVVNAIRLGHRRDTCD